MGSYAWAATLVAVCFSLTSVQATRSGPFLQPGTIVIVQRLEEPRLTAHSLHDVFARNERGHASSASLEGGTEALRSVAARGAHDAASLGHGSWISQTPYATAHLTIAGHGQQLHHSTRHNRCRHAQHHHRRHHYHHHSHHGKHAVADRYGAELVLAGITVHQKGQTLWSRPMGGVDSGVRRSSIGTSASAGSNAANERLAGQGWHAKDFVARYGEVDSVPLIATSQAQVTDQSTMAECAHFRSFPALHSICLAGRREAALKRLAAHESRRDAERAWDVYTRDTEVIRDVVVFVLLCVACIAVWCRLFAMFFRSPVLCGRHSPRRHRHRRHRHCSRSGCDGEKGPSRTGLAQPLLDSLVDEGAITGKGNEVEVAAEHTQNNPAHQTPYVTLQYQPLASESK